MTVVKQPRFHVLEYLRFDFNGDGFEIISMYHHIMLAESDQFNIYIYGHFIAPGYDDYEGIAKTLSAVQS